MAENEKNINEKQNKWEDRNLELSKLKASGDFGWVHLITGQNKITKHKFLRLKRYMNWFSIPDAEYLVLIQQMLKKGAENLGWSYNPQNEIKIDEIKNNKKGKLEESESNLNMPDEVVGFIKKYPDFTKQVLSINLKSKDPKFVLDMIDIIDEAVSKSGERFKIAFKELLPKITKQNTKGIQDLSDLMEKWNLYQITSLTNIIKIRLDTIETLDQMIHNDKTYEIKEENSIHRILEKNMWLINENYWIVQSNKSLRNFIGDEILKDNKNKAKKRPDFVCVNQDKRIIILEIKRPSLELKKEELDQVELYQRLIKKYKSEKVPVEVFLIGNKISEEARDIVELRKGIEIKTYQDFLDGCRQKYQEYLKVIEG